MDKLGERIFALRTGRGMSQGDLAAALDVSRQAVSKWENGMGTPTPENIVAMSALFCVTTDYILLGKEDDDAHAEAEAPRTQEGFGKRKIVQLVGIMLIFTGALISFAVLLTDFFAEILIFTAYMIISGAICLLAKEDLRTKIFIFTIIYASLVALALALCEMTYNIW